MGYLEFFLFIFWMVYTNSIKVFDKTNKPYRHVPFFFKFAFNITYYEGSSNTNVELLINIFLAL